MWCVFHVSHFCTTSSSHGLHQPIESCTIKTFQLFAAQTTLDFATKWLPCSFLKIVSRVADGLLTMETASKIENGLHHGPSGEAFGKQNKNVGAPLVGESRCFEGVAAEVGSRLLMKKKISAVTVERSKTENRQTPLAKKKNPSMCSRPDSHSMTNSFIVMAAD